MMRRDHICYNKVMDNISLKGGPTIKTKKDVSEKNVLRKPLRKKGIVLRSQVKAGGFWEDMRALYGMK